MFATRSPRSTSGFFGAALVLTLALVLAPAAVAQNGNSSGGGGDQAAKLEQLKQTFSQAMQAAQQNDYQTAYPKLEQSLQLAQETDQSNAASQIESRLLKLSKNWGNQAIKNEDFPQALQHFEKGLQHTSNDAYFFYGKGLALVNLDSTASAMQTMRQAIEVGQQTGDTRTADLASQRIRDEFVARASEALSAQNPRMSDARTALEALDEMRQYVDPSAKSLFYRAVAQQVLGQHSEAIATAERGLEMHRGSRSDAAKYHFVIAESQMSAGQKSAACQRFQQAAYGDYKARAEHYLNNECDE